MEYKQGDVVLVPFPFRDRFEERARPAIVVSATDYNRRGDVVVAAVTSHAARIPTDYAIPDWTGAGLKMPSTVRMMLATVATSRVLLHVGHLADSDWAQVESRLRSVFGWR